MPLSLESLAALANIAGLVVSVLGLVEARSWLVIASLSFVGLSVVAILYARRQRRVINAASVVIEAYSQALNIIYSAQPAPEAEAAKPCRTFQQFQAAVGKETHEIASELDISRAVVSNLFSGSMTPPIRKRVIDHVVSILKTTIEEFNYALDYALRVPRIGHAKSLHTPTIVPRPCDDIIRDSNMSAARKSYWLEEE